MSRLKKLLIGLLIACGITACWSTTQPPVDTSGRQNMRSVEERLVHVLNRLISTSENQ